MNQKHLNTLFAVLLLSGTPFSQQGPELSIDSCDPPHKGLQMSAILYELDQAAAAGLSSDRIRDDYGVTVDPMGLIEVDVIGPVGGEPIPPSIIGAHGGWIRLTWKHSALVRIPPDRLISLAESLPPGFQLEWIRPAEPLDIVGQGPALTGSDSYRDNGADGSFGDGTGIKVAVLDNGFQYYEETKNNGDVPEFQDSNVLSSGDLEADSYHGTACVEQIYDHAPGAEVYLVKMGSNAYQLGLAVDWCIEKDIDIITMSLSFFNGGWADGDGAACDALQDATSAGILVFVAAGNFALQHWRGAFQDDDGDGWHNWSPSDETNAVVVPPGDKLKVYLQWNDPTSSYDYDLLLYDETITNELVSSENSAGQPEYLDWKNTGPSDQTVKVLIKKVSGASTDLQLFARLPTISTEIEHFVSEGSVTSAAASTSPNVITVGAVHRNDYDAEAGDVMAWSSRGPTNMGNVKPDLVGPTYIHCWSYGDRSSPTVYGIFGGTSCATPNVAGTAAALWSSLPDYSASGIRWLLLRQAQLLRDWGPAGEDDDHGHGGARLYPYLPDTVWVDDDVFNPSGVNHIPFSNVDHAYSAVLEGGRILFLGGNFSQTPTMDKNILLDTVVDPAVIGN